jgi:hypothetical protein
VSTTISARRLTEYGSCRRRRPLEIRSRDADHLHASISERCGRYKYDELRTDRCWC